jgi:hypothetical protein
VQLVKEVKVIEVPQASPLSKKKNSEKKMVEICFENKFIVIFFV